MACASPVGYDLIGTIGKGGFGYVYMAKRIMDEAIVAVKFIQLEQEVEYPLKITQWNHIKQEISILESCKHANIVEYLGSSPIAESPDNLWLQVWIYMEYCDGGSLQSIYRVTGALSEFQIAYACKETLTALEYLHSKYLMHRDIKGANILVTLEGNVKLADFGLSAQITDTMGKRKTIAGTAYWMAPEVIKSEKEEGYNELCDIWSVGITAIELAECKPPLSYLRPFDAFKLICKPRFKPPTLSDENIWSSGFRNFVKATLTKNFERRPTAQSLLQKRFLKGDHLTNQLMKELLDKKNQIMLAMSSAPQLPNNVLPIQPQNIPPPNCNPMVASLNSVQQFQPQPQNFPPPN